MKKNYKAIFLPIDDRILNLYDGYILNEETLEGINKSEIYSEKKIYDYHDLSFVEVVFRFIVIITLLPILLFILIIAKFFKKFDKAGDKIKGLLDSFFQFFKKKRNPQVIKNLNEKYKDAVEENVLEFLLHCKKNLAKTFIYSYQPITEDKKIKLESLIEKSLIHSYVTISKLSDLKTVVDFENISLRNSFLVIKNVSEVEEAKILDISIGYKTNKNIELWKKRKSSSEGGKSEIEWNSVESLKEMKGKVNYYLEAKDSLFFTNDTILFVEDNYNIFLNNYISKNLKSINKRLSEKKMQLLYFPAFKNENLTFSDQIFNFLRYRNAFLYSLNDNELKIVLYSLIQKLSPQEFYRLVLEELEIPYFKRPALLRSIAGGMADSENRFTYRTIEYSTEKDLDDFFDWYINQVRIANDSEGIFYSLAGPPPEYDADWYFGSESKKDTQELRIKIDAIKSEGKYGVLAEALIYMLETIKEENPEIFNKVKPFIEKKKLLESKVVLSPIIVDLQKRIFLPSFGNIEVKMHALPKTVYLFFLQHPEGVRIKELYQYKKDLLAIYNLLTNKSENEEIKKAIDDLVDITNPSINQKCARIREAFRKIMDEHIAKYYYIDGLNGEPKKIALPQNLIDIRYI
jgi:hypothetical protein